MALCADSWNLEIYQYQSWDSFCIQNAPIEKRFKVFNSWERLVWKNCRCISDYDYKKQSNEEILVGQGTEIALDFGRLYKVEGSQTFYTKSETKSAIAERTIRSLKNKFYRCKEDNGYEYNHKLTQFVTTLNYIGNCSTVLIPKSLRNSEFWSILCNKPQREFRKPKFKIGERVRISKLDSSLRKGSKPHFTQELFEIVAAFFKETSNLCKKHEQDEVVLGKFSRKGIDGSQITMESFTVELVSHASVQKCIDNTLRSCLYFYRNSLTWSVSWRLQYRNHSKHQCTKLL